MIWRWSRSRRDDRESLARRLALATAELTVDLELSGLLGRIVRSASELVEADVAGLVLLDRDGPVLAAIHGMPEEYVGHRYEPGEGAIWTVLETGEPLVMAEIREHLRLPDMVGREGLDLHSGVVVPTKVDGQVRGVLGVSFATPGRSTTAAEMEVLALLAAHAGAAVGNAAAFDELARRQRREQAIIDGLADGVVVVGPGGEVTGWNRAVQAMTGIAAAAALGKPVPFEYAAAGQGPVERELADGRWARIEATPLGESGETVLALHDITEQRALEEAKTLFLATTSHELKTPLTVISGFAATLQNRWHQLDEQQRTDALEAITRRSQVLLRLIERLLIGSRADAGTLMVWPERRDLGELLAEAMTGFEGASEHRVAVAGPDVAVAVMVDPQAFEQVIGQLLENAFRYSPVGSLVRVSASVDVDRGLAAVRVVDEGTGIPPEDIDHVFDRFFQASRPRSVTTGGVGLGLFIVRSLVEASGGSVRAYPGDGGVGTTVEFTLPLA